MNTILGTLSMGKTLSEKEMVELSPLIWAYVGDAVYEVMVRTHLTIEGARVVQRLHKKVIGYVSAKGQAERLKKLTGVLTDEEEDIVRRGRNCHSGTIPKNADVNEYRYATGFEALFGYHYLTGRTERLEDLFKILIKQELGSSDLEENNV